MEVYAKLLKTHYIVRDPAVYSKSFLSPIIRLLKMAILSFHRPVTVTSAFASLDISEDSGLSMRNARHILQPPPQLPTWSTFHAKLVKQLLEVEADYAVHPDYLPQKVDLPMTSPRQGWEWGFRKYNTPFSGTRDFFVHGSPLRDDQAQPSWCTPDLPAVPYFTPRVTCFSNIQQTQFWDKPPPAVDTFGHQERPIQPGPLKVVYLTICAFFRMLMTSLSNCIKLAPFIVWELIWSLFTWLVVVPVLALGRLITALRLELIVSVVLAGWVVRKLPGFGESLLSVGAAGAAGLGGVGGVGGGDGEIGPPAWTIFMKSGLAMGRNGPALSK